MKAMVYAITITALVMLASFAQAEEPVVVIVNSANKQEISQLDIKSMYSDMVTTWRSGQRINLYNLPLHEAARETFSRKIFSLSAREVAQQESNRKITNTIKNPSQTKKARSVAFYVSRDKRAVGYIPKSLLSSFDGVRVVLEIP